VPDSSAEPNNLPFNFFNVTSPRGAVFQSTGNIGGQHSFRVSADSINSTMTAPEFGNVNASYPAIFTPFSAERLFRAVGSTTIDVEFFMPGTNIPATVSGFGVVLTDVDGSSSYIEGYAADGTKLAGFTVNTFNNGLSFLGFSFNAGERIARVQIGAGNLPMSASNTDGGAVDVVAMDDFIYGEPQPEPSTFRFAESQFTGGEGGSATVSVVRSGPGSASVDFATADGTAGAADYTPSSGTLSFAPGETVKTISVPLAADNQAETDETVNLTLSNPVGGSLGAPASAMLSIVDRPPAADRTRPTIALGRILSRMKLAAFRRGVVVRVRPSEPSAIDLELVGTANRAVVSRLGDVTLASKQLRRAGGRRTVRLRPKPRLLSSSRRGFTARLRVTATDAAGNRRVIQRRIRIVR
jgi:Calx-beta domain